MKKKICSALCLSLAFFGATQTHAFSDILPGNTNAHIFQHLNEVGIMGPLEGNTFQSQRIITRAEALTIALRSGGIAIPRDFNAAILPADTDPNSWYAPTVARAISLKLIGGQGYNFRPNEYVTKAEFLTFLARSTKVNLTRYEKRTRNVSEDILPEDWYAPTFAYAKRFQIAHLPADRKYRPNKLLTRQEVALMTHRQLQVFHGSATDHTFLEMKANIDQFMTLLRADKPQLAQQHLQKIRDLTQKLAQQQNSTDSVGAHALAMSMQHFTDSLQSMRSQKRLKAISELHLAQKQAQRAHDKSDTFKGIANEFKVILSSTLTDILPQQLVRN